MTRWHRPAGSTATNGYTVDIAPELADWRYTGLRVLRLGVGEGRTLQTGPDEVLIVPLAGAVTVRCAAGEAHLAGRDSVFTAVTDVAYVPRDSRLTLTSPTGGSFALASARAERRQSFQHIRAEQVPVELRGAGSCSRQVVNFGIPEVLDADRLIACEVLTPAGNWSSYPPHKHDEERPGESVLEEIYYFETPGVGFQRAYGTAERPFDVLAEVRAGDVVLIPHGWHGPSMAAPGYDLYYLNVMAGPGRRSWLVHDDPTHAWVRDTWVGQAVDPRLPMTRAVVTPASSTRARQETQA